MCPYSSGGASPFLREVCDIMLSWIRPVAVQTSQFFLSDENGEVNMPSRKNGGQVSLRQEVDFDSLHTCPQKTGHALTAGPAVDQWDWKCIFGNVVRYSRLPDIPELTDRKGFRSLNRKYGLTLCVISIQSSIQPFENGPVTSSYPRLESHDETLMTVRFGDRTFHTASPLLWNALPISLKDSSSVFSFKRNLKTHLFKQTYID